VGVKTFIFSSAVLIYGDSGGEVIAETATARLVGPCWRSRL
jgi:UDP-glucose 4-epimerase